MTNVMGIQVFGAFLFFLSHTTLANNASNGTHWSVSEGQRKEDICPHTARLIVDRPISYEPNELTSKSELEDHPSENLPTKHDPNPNDFPSYTENRYSDYENNFIGPHAFKSNFSGKSEAERHTEADDAGASSTNWTLSKPIDIEVSKKEPQQADPAVITNNINDSKTRDEINSRNFLNSKYNSGFDFSSHSPTKANKFLFEDVDESESEGHYSDFDEDFHEGENSRRYNLKQLSDAKEVATTGVLGDGIQPPFLLLFLIDTLIQKSWGMVALIWFIGFFIGMHFNDYHIQSKIRQQLNTALGQIDELDEMNLEIGDKINTLEERLMFLRRELNVHTGIDIKMVKP